MNTSAPFVVGVGRSGTTLLRLMLDAHPDLAIPPETHFLDAIVAAPEKYNAAMAFYKIVTSHPTWNDFDIPKGLFKKALKSCQSFTLTQGLRVFYQLYAMLQGKRFWGDKTPIYLAHIDKIHRLLPESKFIHIIRDGRDVALSYQKVWFGPKDVVQAATMWQQRIARGRQLAIGLPYLEIRYEDLIMDTEACLKKCAAFIGVDYCASMLDYHKTSEQRLQQFKNIRQPQGKVVKQEERRNNHVNTLRQPLAERCYAWKKVMTKEDRLQFENIAKPLLEELAYDLSVE